MSQTFARVVEHVKQLSLDEKQELLELLNRYLIEEQRGEVFENQASIEEMRNRVRRQSGSVNGKLSMSEDFDKPVEDFAEYME